LRCIRAANAIRFASCIGPRSGIRTVRKNQIVASKLLNVKGARHKTLYQLLYGPRDTRYTKRFGIVLYAWTCFPQHDRISLFILDHFCRDTSFSVTVMWIWIPRTSEKVDKTSQKVTMINSISGFQ
jgi:hypothetical protein